MTKVGFCLTNTDLKLYTTSVIFEANLYCIQGVPDFVLLALSVHTKYTEGGT